MDSSHLKNSFFSSSVFRIRLLRKFITSKKSFLLRENHSVFNNKYISQCYKSKRKHLFTDRKKSWVSRELRGGRDRGSGFSRPACRVISKLSNNSWDTRNNMKMRDVQSVRQNASQCWQKLRNGYNITTVMRPSQYSLKPFRCDISDSIKMPKE